MRKNESQRGDRARQLALVVGVALVASAIAYAVFHLVTGDAGSKKHVIEVVQLKLIPPPPPPKVEPPPPPPKIVEQKIQPPVQKPDDKPKDRDNDKPPPGPLALDAKGGPGSDAFGLGGKQGGADYIGGEGGGRGVGWAHYSALLQDQIGRRLHEDEALDVSKFRITLKLWLSTSGKMERVEVFRATGNTEIDNRVREDIATMEVMPEAPSPDMPQPVIVRVGARPANET